LPLQCARERIPETTLAQGQGPTHKGRRGGRGRIHRDAPNLKNTVGEDHHTKEVITHAETKGAGKKRGKNHRGRRRQ